MLQSLIFRNLSTQNMFKFVHKYKVTLYLKDNELGQDSALILRSF
jgi:hypothetical protein